MTLKIVQCVVKVGNNFSEPVDAKRGLRQADSLNCNFSNIFMQRINCASGLSHSGTIFYKSVMPLEYADDADIIGGSDCEVAVAFSMCAEEVRSIGLAANESKLRYFVSAANDSSIREYVEIDGYNFEIVKNFVYLGSSMNTDQNISLEIRRSITLANRCYFGLRKQLSKRARSWRTKI